MISAGVQSLLVVDAGAPVGALTWADLQRAAKPATQKR
jgi:hypothetical protein